MVTRKGSALKKFLLIFLATLFVLACVFFLSGCTTFDKSFVRPSNPDPDPDPDPDPTPGVTGMQSPERARFDMISKTLYVSDCSESGVACYEVVQKQGTNKNSVGKLDATNLQAENGFFAIALNNVWTNEDSFELTVWCLEKPTDRSGVTKKFTFSCGGKIECDIEHCAFDNDTGEYTWTAVEGATGYAIAENGGSYDAVVTKPSYTVDESVYSFSVLPLFDEDDKYGYPETVNLTPPTVGGGIYYDSIAQLFKWSRYCDCEYTVKITDGDNVVEGAAKINESDYRDDAEFSYTPTTDTVKIQLTMSKSKLFRPYTENEVTYSVHFAPSDIALNTTTGELTWSKVEDFSQYEVILEYGDGLTSKFNPTTEKLSLSTQYSISGTVTARIRAAESRYNISLYSEPYEFAILYPTSFNPVIKRGEEPDKLVVSVDVDTKNVLGYDVTLTSDSGSKTATMDCADAVDGTVSTVLTVPVYEVIDLRVSRRFIGPEGRTYFRAKSDDFTKEFMFANAPEVVVTDKNAQGSSNESGFNVKVSFPESVKGKGRFTVSYSYENSRIKSINRSYTVSDDYNEFMPRPNHDYGKYTFKVSFSKFYKNDGSTVTLYYRYFQTAVESLGSVSVSSADASEIVWSAVGGADEYKVERQTSGGGSEEFRTGQTTCTHSITEAGELAYYITPTSNEPFVMDGDRFECTIEKLDVPALTLNADGTVSVQAQENAFVVTKLDGEVKLPTKDAMLGALENKAEVQLAAYSMGINTASRFYINSGETTYTLHRIADVDSDDLGLTVDASEGIVEWSEIAGVSGYFCRLFRKVTEDGESVLERAFTRDISEIDGSALRWGYYTLEVKPMSYSEDNDFYVYFGDHAQGSFIKNGIGSVDLASSMGYNFDITYECFENLFNVAYLTAVLDDSDPVNVGKTGEVDLSKGLKDALAATTIGMHQITFSVLYVRDTTLSAEKTLKADDYVLTFEVKKSEAPEVESGSYTLTDSQDNSTLDQVNVTVTHTGHTLNAAESYSMIHTAKGYNGSVTKMFEKKGTSAVVTVSSLYYNIITLRTVSDQFTKDNNELVFYVSSDESETNYTFAVNGAYPAEVDSVYVKANSIDVTISVDGSTGYTLSHWFVVEYQYEGKWVRYKEDNVEKFGFSTTNIKQMTLKLPTRYTILSIKQIKIRIRHCDMYRTGLYVGESCWNYLYATIPS